MAFIPLLPWCCRCEWPVEFLEPVPVTDYDERRVLTACHGEVTLVCIPVEDFCHVEPDA